jgi:ABC-type phosphate/phosphonate transport system substrate-binding protein
MIADLPMYDWPGVRAANDAFWAEVANRLGAAGIATPPRLARLCDPAASWTDPDLLLGQTCGMPFVSGDCGRARIVARPDYGLPDARDGCYRSVIVVRAGEADGTGPEAVLARQGCRVAVNEWRSYSGHIALREYLAEAGRGVEDPFFDRAVLSGSHASSARTVAGGAADMAALDAVAWALLEAHEPETAGKLAVIERTAPAPALPFITAPRFAGLSATLAAALDAAAAVLPPVTGVPRGVRPAGEDDYDPIRRAARRAAAERFAPGAPAPPSL